jgi:DNA-binding XRE family transcriptional regulator
MNFGGWTNFEERQVRELYPSAPRAKIVEAIPRHTWKNISVRANALKVKRIYPQQRAIHPFILSLVARRKARGMTQETLAFAASMDRAAIARLERGHKLPTFTTLQRWCKALGGELDIVEKISTP